jgi:hypothetical protein
MYGTPIDRQPPRSAWTVDVGPVAVVGKDLDAQGSAIEHLGVLVPAAPPIRRRRHRWRAGCGE